MSIKKQKMYTKLFIAIELTVFMIAMLMKGTPL